MQLMIVYRCLGELRSMSESTVELKSRTVTYQRSFFIRACRTWNVLPDELRTNHISLASFNCLLLQYYNRAIDLYDADDIRTWRIICPKCNTAKTLLRPPFCYF